MNEFEVDAQARHDRGKGASRRLRRTGKIPAVVYGAHKDPVAVQLNHNELLLHTAHEAFYSHILSLKIDGQAENVVLKDMQRHPYKPFIMHMDFLRVDAAEQLTMRVPLHFLNEDSCVGVKAGGVVSHLMVDIEITCLPRDLPEFITVDIQALDVGDSLHLGDLQMPADVAITAIAHGGDETQPVVQITQPRVASDDDDDAPSADATPDEAAPEDPEQ
jgi:large subunit ribosomal protein L25